MVNEFNIKQLQIHNITTGHRGLTLYRLLGNRYAYSVQNNIRYPNLI